MKSSLKITERICWLRLISFSLISVERFSISFWRILSWVMLFCALWLFQIPAFFGQIAGIAALLGFMIGFVFFIWRDTVGFRFPNMREVDRRIERDSNIRGRPLSGVQDTLANDDKEDARALWAISRAKLRALFPHLNTVKLRGTLAMRDPYAIRLAIFMAFILGLMAAGPEWSMRIKDGITPVSFSHDKKQNIERFTLIITAPDYTSLPQMILNDRTIRDETLKIAQGSTIKVLVNGGWGTPSLRMNGIKTNLKTSDTQTYSIETTFPNESGHLVLKQGLLTLAQWPFEITPDTPPSISLLKEEPQVLDNGALSFSLSVKDDFGVAFLDAEMDLADDVPRGQIGEKVIIRRSIVSPDGEDFEITPIYDFTAHSWAGLPATITFTAVDEKGQTTSLPPVSFVLPERDFQHPIAKTLIALRKRLAWAPEDSSTYNDVRYDLHVLSTAKDLMNNDVVVFMALRSAALRLHYNIPSFKITKEAMALMWDTALRVEDGDLSHAARRLRDAQMALEKALQNPDITNEEIASLMQDMREAMAEYFNELAREMQKRMAEGQEIPNMPPDMIKNAINSDALNDFLEQMEQAMRDGNMKSAQEMLSQMQRLMDMLNPSMNAQIPPDMQMMQEGVNELQQLIERQETLLKQTEKQADLLGILNGLGLNDKMNHPRSAPEESDKIIPPFVNTEENQTEQDGLRYILGQLMVDANEVIGQIPPGMGLAEQDMRGSSEQLGLNRPDTSIPHQELALEHLKDAQQDLAQQLQKRMVQMTGFMLSFSNSKGMRRDPLGRPMGDDNGANEDPYGSHVKIPDEAEQRRVQEILKLLRQRAGEHDRPREELDYYRRLLKRF